MGFLAYAHANEFEFDDRVLAHVKAAIGMKLRKHESFFLSWSNPAERGSGRLSVWVSPSIPMIFRFSGNRPPELNRVWVDVLVDLSNSARGMVVVAEKEAEILYSQKNAATQSG